MPDHSRGSLRTIIARLSSAHTDQLPYLVAEIIPSLIDCKTLISTTHSNSPDAPLLRKLKVQISALLADKSPKKRWAAIVLIKTLVDVGGWPILQEAAPWIRGLLSILAKNDPATSKKLSVLTLTKIFLLTHQYQTLVRELSTPNLPPFVTACLTALVPKSKQDGSPMSVQQLKAKNLLTSTILRSFEQLLPLHPTVFRSFASQIKGVLLNLVAPAEFRISPVVQESARSLFPLLHFCAPKSSGSVEWSKTIDDVVNETHQTANYVFRAVQEDWSSTSGINAAGSTSMGELVNIESKSLSLPAWNGIQAGCQRLTGLTQMLKHFVNSQTNADVSLPLGNIADVIIRLSSIAVPSSKSLENQRLNEQIGRDEREGLWSELPAVHIAVMQLIVTLYRRLGNACISLCNPLLDQVSWVFKRESYSLPLRASSYTTITTLLNISGLSLRRDQIRQLGVIIEACCDDLLHDATSETPQSVVATSNAQKNSNTGAGTMNADDLLGKTQKHATIQTKIPVIIAQPALDLLTTFLATIPAQLITSSTRALIDRTSVLLNHAPALLASTLNPPRNIGQAKTSSSLLTLLARGHSGTLATEGVIRPRMPMIQMNQVGSEEDESDDESTVVSSNEISLSRNEADGVDTNKTQDDHIDAIDSYTAGISTFENDSQVQAWSIENGLVNAENADATRGLADEKYVSLKRNSPGIETTENDRKRVRLYHDGDQAEVETPDSLTDRDMLASHNASIQIRAKKAIAEDTQANSTISSGVPREAEVANEEYDDDDDFEIPPLTMEPDTDEEE